MGRTIGTCLNCQETRELVKGVCFTCYRRREREQERDVPWAADVQADRHNRNILKQQGKWRKSLTAVIGGLDNLVDLISEEDYADFRRLLQPYAQGLARLTPRPTTMEDLDKSNSEQESESERSPESVNNEQKSESERSLDALLHFLASEEKPEPPRVAKITMMTNAAKVSIPFADSELQYIESWLPDADQWFARLRDEIPWSPETVMMFGKALVLKRETCNYGDDYDYNANAKKAIEWGGPVLQLKNKLEQLTGRVFTQCACNFYPDGETGIGLHHDKRHPSVVASISFGAVRRMGFAPKGQKKIAKSLPMVPLASGSLLLFTDAINEKYKHAIVEDKSVQEARISVTFREFASAENHGSRQSDAA